MHQRATYEIDSYAFVGFPTKLHLALRYILHGASSRSSAGSQSLWPTGCATLSFGRRHLFRSVGLGILLWLCVSVGSAALQAAEAGYLTHLDLLTSTAVGAEYFILFVLFTFPKISEPPRTPRATGAWSGEARPTLQRFQVLSLAATRSLIFASINLLMLVFGISPSLLLAAVVGAVFLASLYVDLIWRTNRETDWGYGRNSRFWLTLTGQLPRRPLAFLHYAHDREVLRRSGDSYQFRHRLLQDRLGKAWLETRRQRKMPRRDALRTRLNLAKAKHWNGDLVQAEVDYTEVLRDQIALAGKAHRHTLSISRQLASLHWQMGEWQTAFDELQDSLYLATTALGRRKMASVRRSDLVRFSVETLDNIVEILADSGYGWDALVACATLADFVGWYYPKNHSLLQAAVRNLDLMYAKFGHFIDSNEPIPRDVEIPYRLIAPSWPEGSTMHVRGDANQVSA